MSFLALGFRLSLTLRRAIVAVVFGAIGFVLALGSLDDQSKYENFLLVIAYWIGPWLGVVFTDWYLRRRNRVDGFLFDRRHNPWAGWISMLVAGAVSILLFSNQQKFQGLLVRSSDPNYVSPLGDIAFEVGFVLAVVLYWLFFRLQRDRADETLVVPDTSYLALIMQSPLIMQSRLHDQRGLHDQRLRKRQGRTTWPVRKTSCGSQAAFSRASRR